MSKIKKTEPNLTGEPEERFPPYDLANEIAALTLEDIVMFFDAKLQKHHCPACLENNWTAIREEDAVHGLISQQLTGGPILPPPMFPLVSVFCNHCGYIRSHLAVAIVDWKKHNG